MAEFKTVFSTTLKVWVSLVIIGSMLGLGYLILSSLHSTSSRGSDYADNEKFRDNEADSAHTKMPKTAWENGVNEAIKAHCVTTGMSQDEVRQAFGPPSDSTHIWVYDRRTDRCLRYAGDSCAEYAKDSTYVSFSKNGNLAQLDFGYLFGCQTVDKKSVHPNPFEKAVDDLQIVKAKPKKKAGMLSEGKPCFMQDDPGGALRPCQE